MDVIVQVLALICATIVTLAAIAAWSSRNRPAVDEGKLTGLLAKVVQRLNEQSAGMESIAETLEGVREFMGTVSDILSQTLLPTSRAGADTYGHGDDDGFGDSDDDDGDDDSGGGGDDFDDDSRPTPPRIATIRRSRR